MGANGRTYSYRRAFHGNCCDYFGAGAGTRMKLVLKKPKVAHEVLAACSCGWVRKRAKEAGADRVVTVVGHQREQVIPLVEGDTEIVVRRPRRHGRRGAGRRRCPGWCDGAVVVLPGDSPLIQPETIAGWRSCAEEHNAAVIVPHFMGLKPLRLRSHHMRWCWGGGPLVEQKDASPEEVAITECNPGVYCSDAQVPFRRTFLQVVNSDNAQGEFYLTDAGQPRCRKWPVLAYKTSDAGAVSGVNSCGQLAEATRVMQRRINDAHMAAGVTMWIRPRPPHRLLRWRSPPTELLPNVMLLGKTNRRDSAVP